MSSIKAMNLVLKSLKIIKTSYSEGRVAHAENEMAIAEYILLQAIAEAEKQAEKQEAQCRPPGKSWLTVNPEGNLEMRKLNE
jgi:hypothetical protein